MAILQHMSNAKMLQLLNGNNDFFTNNYISQNLAVARNIPTSSIEKSFLGEPFISDEMRFIMIKKGGVILNINLVEHQFEPNNLAFLNINGIIEIKSITPGTEAIAMALSDDLFSMVVGKQIPSSFDGHLRDFIIKLHDHEMDFIDQIHLMLSENIKQDEHSPQVIMRLMSAILWQIDYLHGKQEQFANNNATRDQQIFAAFIQLVSQFAPQHHGIEFYADKLCLSPRYVGNLIKNASGKTAKQWIDDSIVTRIKIELQHSDKQIQQIADEMNFGNTSFFTKYFRRMTGITPNEFRKEMHH